MSQRLESSARSYCRADSTHCQYSGREIIVEREMNQMQGKEHKAANGTTKEFLSTTTPTHDKANHILAFFTTVSSEWSVSEGPKKSDSQIYVFIKYRK